MASSTGVLPFLRGADFSHNNFKADNFPHTINQLKGLKWLRIDKTHLDFIPEAFIGLDKLERLNLAHNELKSLIGELICLKNLKFLDCRHNLITGDSVPEALFNLETLAVLDISHNKLRVIPKGLSNCKSLQILNLSHNGITNIDDDLFKNLTGLTYLDLSNNELKTVPPQVGRLLNLTTLILNNNPFELHKIRQLDRLKSLKNLHLANTQRNNQNTPLSILGELTNLVELNLSSNQLNKVPEDLSHFKELRRLNLSNNLIEKVPTDFGDWWPNLETLNLSENKLTSLPPSLCRLCNLKRLYFNDNQVTFDGLPAALGKLHKLEVLMAARNNLELIPESIFRCGKLKKLILTSNRLITLPDTIHLLYDLEILELSDNPELMMPPKPLSESQKNSEFYNIDFSLNTQLRLAGDPNLAKLPQQQTVIKDPIARKLRLRKRAKDDEQDENQAKVLKGMKDLVKEKDSITNNQSDFLEPDLKPKRWDEILERPPIDYSDFFDETTGQIQGLTIWEIENFCPVLMDPGLHGKFFDADCYIILSTEIDENLSLNWRIFYWIGTECTLDKKACSAIHAVSLRNFLNAQCRTIREEQGEESDEFLALFPDGIDYVRGARTSSGFYTVEETEYPHRMFRLHEASENMGQLHLETVALSSESLDSRFVYLIDAGYKIYIWSGSKLANKTTKQKARLLGEKLNKEERKNKAELIFCSQGDEPSELKEELDLRDTLPDEIIVTPTLPKNFEVEKFQPIRPVLYQISLGMGYIELLQVDFESGKLLTKHLLSTNSYILDCVTDSFVWLGRKSPRLARNAALKLAQELFVMIKRPSFATITSCLQGTESHLFKSKFKDWDNVIAVDYTRTAESVSKTGANLAKWMSEQKVKIDLASLFSPRPEPLTEEDAQILLEDWNEELEIIDIYILDKGKRFSKISDKELGHFYTEDCYVFLCRCYDTPDDFDENSQGDAGSTGANSCENSGDTQDDFKCVVYFWQGRLASNMGWLTFTFGLQKKFQTLFGDRLEVVRMHQQQENLKFLAQFKQKFIIHQGKRRSILPEKEIGFYHLRSNSNPLTLRCIEIGPDASKLNSGFCYILRSNQTTESKLFVWIGSKSNPKEAKIAGEIADSKFNIDDKSQSVTLIHEGQEPDEFWQLLGGKQNYDTDPSFMTHIRLFRCSNDKGYFCISEKYTDFCQDDLSDDDIMILDNGDQVFLWIGPKSSEVEVKLAYKSAQVYVQNLRIKEESNPRQLLLTIKGKESRKFTKCFHGWSSFKVIKY